VESYFLNSWAEPGFSVIYLNSFRPSPLILFNVLLKKRVDVIMFYKAALKC